MKALGPTAIGIGAATALMIGALVSFCGGSHSPRGSGAIDSLYGGDRDTEMERQRVALINRGAAKMNLCRAVVRRELSLLEAARQVRDLVRDDPTACALLRDLFPNCSDEELFCRHLMGFVEGHVLEPWAAAAELARLDAELDDLRRRDALHFPDAPALTNGIPRAVKPLP
jgi:hypothetical protein